MRNILTIAGSDSSGGAGIQNDLKTIAAHGHHGLSVITAVTAQNSESVLDIHPVDNVNAQLKALAEDIPIHGVKIGMLYTVVNVIAAIDFLKCYGNASLPVVLDPMMFASTGRQLITDEAMFLIVNELMPLCTLVTPNRQECEHLTGMTIDDSSDAAKAAIRLTAMTGISVLLKGGHLKEDTPQSIDLLYDGHQVTSFGLPRLMKDNTHGTGCCLSSAITCRLAEDRHLARAVRKAKDFVTTAINHGYPLGKGEGPVDPLIHFITNHVTMNDVANSCLAAGARPIMAEAKEEMSDIIPQHQGLVINMGTITAERLHTMEIALEHVASDRQKVLLDPVGCNCSNYRLQGALDLLATGKINILKVNPREGMALIGINSHGAYGVDSDELNAVSKKQLASDLQRHFSQGNPELIVVVTGRADVIADAAGTQVVRGGSAIQQKITGTGCMLNAVIMAAVTKTPNTRKAIIRALTVMNRASERAVRELKNKKHLMTYKEKLINELTSLKRDVYLITDERLDFETTLLPITERALKYGVGIVQYRVKNKPESVRYHEASTLKRLCDDHGVTFIINDDVRLAKAVGSDGVHLGINDDKVAEARHILGDKCLIGATAKTVTQAKAAEEMGADYLGVGALNPSSTKKNAIPVTIQELKAIREAVSLPIYAIGGIRHHNLTQEIMDHIDGVAVVSAVYDGGCEELQKILNKL